MTVDVLAMGCVAFLTGVLYTDFRAERVRDRLMHEIHNLHVRLGGIEAKLPAPPDYDDSKL